MNQAVYDTISGANLLDNYKVHYYFDKYTGDPDPYLGTNTAYIYSDAESQYSGKIFSYEEGAHSADALAHFTGDLGTGTFSGGVNQFYDYVTIENSEDLFSGDFTFLISTETTSRQDLGENKKGPVSNNNILFSNLSGEGFSYSGLQIGINAANRAYIEMHNGFQGLILTYMGQQPPYPQNIWSFMANSGSMKVGLYDIETQGFLFNAIGNQSGGMYSPSPWRIGSGINFDPNATFSPEITLNSGLFAGKMDNFIYFNTGMSDTTLSTVGRSIYSSLYEKTQPTYSSGIIQFNYESLTGFVASGIVEDTVSCSVTGYVTGTITFEEKVEITGDVAVGTTYYLPFSEAPHPISGVVKEYRALYNNGAVATGITGFSGLSYETGIVTPITGCSGSGVSGVIVSGSGVSGTGVGGFTGILTSGVSGLIGEPSSYLQPDAFSYIGGDFGGEAIIERYSVSGVGTLNRGSLNNLARVGETTLKDGRGFFLKSAVNSGSLGLYLNGVGREIGGITLKDPLVSRVFYSRNRDRTYAQTNLQPPLDILDKADFAPDSETIKTYFNEYNVVQGDVYVSGREILEGLDFINPRTHIMEIYDTGLNTGAIRSRWEVSDTEDYESPPSPNPISGDQWVFFNGQKLVSGMDYFDDAGFVPTGYITGATGLYFTLPPISGATRTTGTVLNFEENSFFPNSEIIFINGIRQDVSEYYVQHSRAKDLISGKETLKNYGTSLFNNYN
tara:strand:- start:1949 stop:4138 length:2190 start_codon:yes stop_codon:yes gene_type:complete